jgi:hypothetical protein
MSPLARPSFGSLAVMALAVLASGTACRSKKTASGAVPSAGASAPAPAVSAPSSASPAGCRMLKAPALVIGDTNRPPKPSDEDDDPELPFAPAIGSAVALSSGFAVSGIATKDGRMQAFVAFVPDGDRPGRTVFLGAVHGDPDPPLIAVEGDRVLVALETSDAGGGVVELYRLAAASDAPERGAEIVGVRDSGIGLAVGEKSSVVVWSPSKGPIAMLRSASTNGSTPRPLGAERDIAGTNDAESPVVRARSGGFWLAFIAEKPSGDAGVREKDASAEETRPLDAVPRVLMVALLGADGAPSGAARPVSGESSHVVAFDAVTLDDGALALAWREDDAAPGGETGSSELARVGPDGAIQRGRAADEALSAGAPALVREGGRPGRVWLIAPGEDDRMRLALLQPNAVSTSAFVGDDVLRGADILAAAPGTSCGKEACVSFLLARAKHRSVELGIARCPVLASRP